MRMTYLAVLGGTVGLMVVSAWAGCSNSNTNPNGGTDGGGAQPDQYVPVADSGGSNDAGTTSDTGVTSDAGPTADAAGGDSGPPVSCTDYCATILLACGAADGGVGGNAQYYDTTDCMNTCALFTPGKYGETANSLGCRQYHAHLALTGPVVHCPHAGAGGGGLCGARCDDFCSLAMAHCSAANGADPPYNSQADCLAACNAYPYDLDASDYDPNDISTLNCLDYHLRESLGDLAGQGIDGGHCDDLSIDGGAVRGACHP